jgi:hypothetical protein
MEKQRAEVVPERLSLLLKQGLRGHHPLFDAESIRQAYQSPEADPPVANEDADDVGQALLAMCRNTPSVARGAVETLSPRARQGLIRLYFRLLDKAQGEQALSGSTH